MAENYVEIRIKASDTAKPDLTDLKVKLDELGSKVETARVDVNDEDGKAKLLAMNAKLAALNQRVANPRIKVAGAARAEADIAAVEASLKHLSDETAKLDQKAQQNSGKGGLLGKLLFGSGGDSKSPGGGGGGGGILGSFGSLPSGGIGGLLSNPYSLAAIASAAQAALVEVTGLASGFAAAGAGVASFGLVAKSNLTTAATAATKVQTAQDTYNVAIANGVKHATAYRAEQVAIGKAYAELSPAQIALSKTIGSVQNAWQSFVQSNTAGVSKVLTQGIGLLPKIFQDMQIFMAPTEKALSGLISMASKGLNSAGFKSFLDTLAANSGPSITAIGEGIGRVMVAIGRLLTIMSQKDIINSINIAFSVLAGTITGVGYVIRFIMMQWDALTTAFDTGRSAAKTAGHDIASAFDTARHAAADLAHNVAAHFGEIRHDTANLAHNIASYFDEMRANIHRWATGVISFVRSNWKLLAAIILGPLGLVQDAISTHLRGIETAFRVAWGVISAVVRVAVGVITAIVRPFAALLEPLFKSAWSSVVAVFSWAFGSMRSTTSGGTSAIRGVLSWFGGLAGMFRRWWSAATSAVAGEIGRLIGFVRTIPGRVNSALGGLPGMLWNAGVRAIEGLIHGMGSMVGSAMSMAAGWGHDIVNALGSAFGIHFSEPSEASKMIAAGKQIPRGLASGMLSGTGALRSAAGTVSGAAYPHTGAGGGRAGAGGAGGTLKVQLEFVGGDDMLLRGLRNAIRVRGGNVQTVLGH